MTGEPSQGEQQLDRSPAARAKPRRLALPLLAVLGLAAVGALVFLRTAAPDDLGLGQVPGVADVAIPVHPAWPARRIIHVLDRPFVPPERYHGSAPYEQYVRDVEALQQEQMEVLRWLAARFYLKVVFAGDLTPLAAFTYRVKINELAAAEHNQIAADRDELKARPGDKEVAARVEAHHRRLLALNAAGRLKLRGALADVLGTEDEGPFEAVRAGKTDGPTRKARADGIVRIAQFADEPVMVLLLDADVDLSDSVREFDPRCAYLRVTPGRLRDLAPDR